MPMCDTGDENCRCGKSYPSLDGGEIGTTITPQFEGGTLAKRLGDYYRAELKRQDESIERMLSTEIPTNEDGTVTFPLMSYATKDSGERVVHDSGMVRDTNQGKPRFDLMIPKGIPFEELYLTRVARLYERGAQKYEPRNWEKADSEEELDRAKESAYRHFMQWFAGETDEDHAAAVFFNINEVETIRTKLHQQ